MSRSCRAGHSTYVITNPRGRSYRRQDAFTGWAGGKLLSAWRVASMFAAMKQVRSCLAYHLGARNDAGFGLCARLEFLTENT